MTHHDNKHVPSVNAVGPCAIRRKPQVRRGLSMLVLATTLPLVAVAGCAKKHSENHFTVGSVKSDYKSRHPIVLSEQEQTLDVPITSSMRDLPVASKSSIRGFVSGFKSSASGHMTILLPTGSPNESAARTISKKMVEVVSNAGVPSQRISMVTYYAGDHGSAAPIRLSYAAVNASVTGCGKWTADLTENKENKNYHNFGCATQSNLASMISNPADLIGPRGMSSIDAARRAKVIEDYRTATEPNTRDDTYTTITPTFGN